MEIPARESPEANLSRLETLGDRRNRLANRPALFRTDVSIANKQLRFLARFLTVCLLLNRREVLQKLVDQLKVLVEECKRVFQDSDFKE
ncbi:hypothetical protein RYX36_034969 [Vicia faba]